MVVLLNPAHFLSLTPLFPEDFFDDFGARGVFGVAGVDIA
jgi:hypothetical protein